MSYKYIYHIFNTIFCMYQRPYKILWDEKLNEYLKGGALKLHWNEYSSGYLIATITLEDGKSLDLWISGKYYSYATLYKTGFEECRPKFKTMLLLEKMVNVELSKIRVIKDKEIIQKYKEL